MKLGDKVKVVDQKGVWTVIDHINADDKEDQAIQGNRWLVAKGGHLRSVLSREIIKVKNLGTNPNDFKGVETSKLPRLNDIKKPA